MQQQQQTLRICQIDRPASGTCGFLLGRTFWDPYPWVCRVDPGSPAEISGLQTGDCVLEVNGEDVLGKRTGELASGVRASSDKMTLLVWNAGSHPNSFISTNPKNDPYTHIAHKAHGWDQKGVILVDFMEPRAMITADVYSQTLPASWLSLGSVSSPASTEKGLGGQHFRTNGELHNAVKIYLHPWRQTFMNRVCESGPTPTSLERLSSCLQSIIQLLECPVCLDMVPPPVFQCCNGHVLCKECRPRADRCPVCRVVLGPRGRCLLADNIHGLLKSTLCRRKDVKNAPANQVTTTSIQSKLYLKSRIVAEEGQKSASSTQEPVVTHEERASQRRASSAEDIPSSPQPSDLCFTRSHSLSAGDIPVSSSPILAQVKQVDKSPFHCPYSLKKERFCPRVLDGNDSLIQHIRECHSGPLVQYYVKRSGVKLRLPLSSSRPIRCSPLLSFVTKNDAVFFAKVAQTPGYRLVWLWMVGDVAQAERYRLRLTLPEGDMHTGPVFPLTSSWEDVVQSNCCLSIEEGRYVNNNPEVRVEILEIDVDPS